jgi:DNA-nicking Smr family endonuclease
MPPAPSSGSQTKGSHRSRVPSPAELELWRRAVTDVRPLDPAAVAANVVTPAALVLPAEPAPASPVVTVARPGSGTPPRTPAPSDLVHGTAAGIDKQTLLRLRRGLIAPELRLDLHNLSQAEAHRALTLALATAQSAGRRCILVITGKGYGADGAVGVLKTMVPRWLVEPPNRARVLAFCHAARGHGGEGALYVLLRRVRTAGKG